MARESSTDPTAPPRALSTESLLEDAIDSLSAGFALWDADDRLITCNSRYREFNRDGADVLVPGVRWEDFARTAIARGQYAAGVGREEAWLEELRQVRATFSSFEYQRDDGRWYHVHTEATRAGGIVVVVTDISRLKEMETALRESDARFRSITSAHPVPVAIVMLDSGEMRYVSEPWAELFRLPADEVTGRPAAQFYARSEDRERFAAAVRETGQASAFEVEMRRGDGSTFWASLTARRFVFEGQPAIVTGVIDLTDRRLAEREIERQREALHQSEKLNALGVLLAGVAHELNNPLSVVLGQSLLLSDTAVAPDVRRRAEQIASAADRCSRIVKTFLAMARQGDPARTSVAVDDVVGAALEVTGYSMRSAGIDVNTDLRAGAAHVRANRDQLVQVLMNLLVNAEQALSGSPAPREIAIRSEALEDEVRVDIGDNGPGIPAELHSKVFDPFFTTKETGVGTGIGLSVSLGIVQAHGGTLTLASGTGRGARFTLSLPRAPAEKPALPRDGEQPAGAGASVLVVDDEAAVAETLAEILALDGHRVEIAGSGSAALEALDEREFDLIVSDLRMPDVDGPTLYERVGERRPELLERFVFVTGDSLGASISRFLATSGVTHMEKPIAPQELRRLARLRLERRCAG